MKEAQELLMIPKRVARGIEQGPFGLWLTPETLQDLVGRCGQLPNEERHDVATQLVAFAGRAWESAGEDFAEALYQIMELVAVCLGSKELAEGLFGALEERRLALSTTGAEISNRPVPSGPGLSPLYARFTKVSKE